MAVPVRAALATPVIRYAAVGVVNTAIDFAVFALCLGLGLGLVTANVIGFMAGATNSFLMNRAITFVVPRACGARARFLRVFGFGLVTLTCVVLSSLIVVLLAPMSSPYLAKAVATLVTLGLGFLANRAVFAATAGEERRA